MLDEQILGYNRIQTIRFSILQTLLLASLRNDANRRFAGIRRPSKTTRNILDDIEKLRIERKENS
jgi:hypothetical protein